MKRRRASGEEERWHRIVHRLRVAFLLLAPLACDDKSAQERPRPAAPETISVASFDADAGILGELVDPPAPAGDLKAELDAFVNVDQCVGERAKLDPLVGDALGAIGYETFLRDACRLLEAAKDRRRETCDRIDSSALRARCQSWVAIIAQTPDACPMSFEGLALRGRSASCVALAARDPRLCQGEARTVERGTCDALIHRDPSRCDVLFPNQRPSCRREVARWRGLLAAPLEGLAPLPAKGAKLAIRGAAGTPDPIGATELDLTPDFVRGVVLVTTRDRSRIELGTVVESEGARIAASPQKRARVGVAVLFDTKATERPSKGPAKASDSLHATIQKLEIELPGQAPLVSPPAVCECKLTMAPVAEARGAEVTLSLVGTASYDNRSYAIELALTTFVRDVVSELPGSRLFPAAHPTLSNGTRPDAASPK